MQMFGLNYVPTMNQAWFQNLTSQDFTKVFLNPGEKNISSSCRPWSPPGYTTTTSDLLLHRRGLSGSSYTKIEGSKGQQIRQVKVDLVLCPKSIIPDNYMSIWTVFFYMLPVKKVHLLDTW